MFALRRVQQPAGPEGKSDPVTDVNAHAVIKLDRRSQNESPQVLYLRKINPYLALSLVMPDDAYKNLCTLLSCSSTLYSVHVLVRLTLYTSLTALRASPSFRFLRRV